MNTNERPFIVSKDVLDTVNSLTWFLMDASWMLQMKEISLLMIVPTILTGVILCYIEKRKNITFINIAILCWICMNVSWMFADIHAVSTYLLIAKSFFCAGLLFILMAVATSEKISDTFSHFKRFRIKNFR
jgi:hypothetical protein